MNTLSRFLPVAARLFLGLVFTVFGLNFFLHFLPMPPMSAKAGAFAGALLGSGYLFPLMKTVEVAAGLALLANRFVPLALALLAPIVVNIVGFHLVVAQHGAGLPLAMLAAEVYLAFAYREAFAPMLRGRNELAGVAAPQPVRVAA
jgi:putative oxidoreductase